MRIDMDWKDANTVHVILDVGDVPKFITTLTRQWKFQGRRVKKWNQAPDKGMLRTVIILILELKP